MVDADRAPEPYGLKPGHREADRSQATRPNEVAWGSCDVELRTGIEPAAARNDHPRDFFDPNKAADRAAWLPPPHTRRALQTLRYWADVLFSHSSSRET